jgi:hypothetical protein
LLCNITILGKCKKRVKKEEGGKEGRKEARIYEKRTHKFLKLKAM